MGKSIIWIPSKSLVTTTSFLAMALNSQESCSISEFGFFDMRHIRQVHAYAFLSFIGLVSHEKFLIRIHTIAREPKSRYSKRKINIKYNSTTNSASYGISNITNMNLRLHIWWSDIGVDMAVSESCGMDHARFATNSSSFRLRIHFHTPLRSLQLSNFLHFSARRFFGHIYIYIDVITSTVNPWINRYLSRANIIHQNQTKPNKKKYQTIYYSSKDM